MRFHVGFSFRLRDLKKFIIPILIAVGIFFGLEKVNAEEVTTISYGTKTTAVNQTSFPVTWTNNVPMVSSPTNIPIKIVDNTGTQFSNYYIKGFSLNFPSPTVGEGKSYTINARFRIYGVGVDLSSNYKSGLTPKLLFERGASDIKDSDTTYTVTSGVEGSDFLNPRLYYEFTISSVVNMNNTYDFNTIYLSLFNNTQFDGSTFDNFYFMTCFMGSDGCSSTTFNATLELLDVDVTISKDLNETLLNGINNSINNQTQLIQDKFDEMFNLFSSSNNETNNKLDNIEDTITDDSIDDNTGFFTDFEEKDFGLSDIVKAPLILIRGLSNGNTCQDLEFNVLGADVTIPSGCILWELVPESVETIYFVFVGGFFAYMLGTKLFHDVNDLKDPEKNEVSTIEL